MSITKTIKQVSLYCINKEKNHDKYYDIVLESMQTDKDDTEILYVIYTYSGRTGRKPVVHRHNDFQVLEAAEKAFDDILKAKIKKGYLVRNHKDQEKTKKSVLFDFPELDL